MREVRRSLIKDDAVNESDTYQESFENAHIHLNSFY